MTMAPTLAGPPRTLRRPFLLSFRGMALDAALFVAAAGVCVALYAEGGIEALAGAAVGAAIQPHNPRTRLAGAFAGLFAGAMFAAFFHNALISALSAIT